MSWLPKGFEFLSGFPEHIRRRRPTLVIQAFFDDSGTKGTGRIMVIAGFIGEASAMANLADEWERLIRFKHPGAIRYFKMDEALHLRGEFAHWNPSKRDEKVKQLSELLENHRLVEVSCAVDLYEFQEVSSLWVEPGPHPFSHPYVFLANQVIARAAMEAARRFGAKTPMEVIFDEQSVFCRPLQEMWDGLRQELIVEMPEHAEPIKILPPQPWFRDDKDFVLLQCADLLAGTLRLRAENAPGNPTWVKSTGNKLNWSEQSLAFVNGRLMIESYVAKVGISSGEKARRHAVRRMQVLSFLLRRGPRSVRFFKALLRILLRREHRS